MSEDSSQPRTSEKRPFEDILDFFRDKNLRPLQADNDGGFDVVPEGVFSVKPGEAISENFKQVKKGVTRIKNNVIKSLNYLGW